MEGLLNRYSKDSIPSAQSINYMRSLHIYSISTQSVRDNLLPFWQMTFLDSFPCMKIDIYNFTKLCS